MELCIRKGKIIIKTATHGEKMYKRVCSRCDKVFVSESKHRKVCGDCDKRTLNQRNGLARQEAVA